MDSDAIHQTKRSGAKCTVAKVIRVSSWIDFSAVIRKAYHQYFSFHYYKEHQSWVKVINVRGAVRSIAELSGVDGRSATRVRLSRSSRRSRSPQKGPREKKPRRRLKHTKCDCSDQTRLRGTRSRGPSMLSWVVAVKCW